MKKFLERYPWVQQAGCGVLDLCAAAEYLSAAHGHAVGRAGQSHPASRAAGDHRPASRTGARSRRKRRSGKAPAQPVRAAAPTVRWPANRSSLTRRKRKTRPSRGRTLSRSSSRKASPSRRSWPMPPSARIRIPTRATRVRGSRGYRRDGRGSAGNRTRPRRAADVVQVRLTGKLHGLCARRVCRQACIACPA